MKHITVVDLKNGYYKLIPEKGYILTDGHNTFTSATVKDTSGWEAIKI